MLKDETLLSVFFIVFESERYSSERGQAQDEK